MQEYADPVIDWLETDGKVFKSRYYRQHCTLINGTYVKDLTSISEDLSNIMIVDNSPSSYVLQEGMKLNLYLYSECDPNRGLDKWS